MSNLKDLWFLCREAVFAEMGVALREDGDTVGVFSPKKVKVCDIIFLSYFFVYNHMHIYFISINVLHVNCALIDFDCVYCKI